MKTPLLLVSILAIGSISPAFADSFWSHNGSLMRLQAQGNNRIITYEMPSDKMRSAGVTKGTLLFDGVRSGDKYSGTARVFSKYCHSSMKYKVKGNVYGETVILFGSRPSYGEGCKANGRMTTDKLVFEYVSSE